jgi:protein-disulfide isomerase
MRGTLFLMIMSAVPMFRVTAATCDVELPEHVKETIADRIHRDFGFLPRMKLYVASYAVDTQTCYTAINLRVVGTDQRIAATFFLSPDRRFLTRELLDLNSARKERETDALLTASMAGQSPVRGRDSSPVTISVFSDFECEFCKEQAQIFDLERNSARGAAFKLVYHYFPLANQAQSRAATEAAACGYQIGPEVFWQMHDWLFVKRSGGGSSDLERSLQTDSGTGISPENTKTIIECMRSHASSKAIDQDLALAHTLNVNSTPTVFIGGRKITGGVVSKEELDSIIDSEANAKDRQSPR